MSKYLYFDIETLTLNPYSVDAKIILAQVGSSLNDIRLYKEWEIGEKNLILDLAVEFDSIKKYTPVFTYNGSFDFSHLLGRINMLGWNRDVKERLHDIFIRHVKHCDLLQFDNGYFVSLKKICKQFGIILESKYDGKHMKELYEREEYDSIVEHGKEDIEALIYLIDRSKVSDRFLKKRVLIDKIRYGR